MDVEAVIEALRSRFDADETEVIARVLRENHGTIPDAQLIEEAALAVFPAASSERRQRLVRRRLSTVEEPRLPRRTRGLSSLPCRRIQPVRTIGQAYRSPLMCLHGLPWCCFPIKGLDEPF